MYIYICIYAYYIYIYTLFRKYFVRKLFTLLGNCSIFFLRKICLNNVPIYSQIHRIRIRYSKYQFIVQNTPKNAKTYSIFLIFRKFRTKKSNNQNIQLLFCNIYKLHSSYFVDFIICVIFVKLYILYIHVPWYCRTGMLSIYFGKRGCAQAALPEASGSLSENVQLGNFVVLTWDPRTKPT